MTLTGVLILLVFWVLVLIAMVLVGKAEEMRLGHKWFVNCIIFFSAFLASLTIVIIASLGSEPRAPNRGSPVRHSQVEWRPAILFYKSEWEAHDHLFQPK